MNHKYKYIKVLEALGEKDESLERFKAIISHWYHKEELSSPEIVQLLIEKTGISYSSRQIMRMLTNKRSQKESFKLAMRKGRVVFTLPIYQEVVTRKNISMRVRYLVMEKAGWKCEKCHNTEKLTVDHKVALSLGGSDEMENLQVLCWPCNQGKAIVLGEKNRTSSGVMRSGIES
jgi:5-methylcytosine-specific restriction endonuclease McrA